MLVEDRHRAGDRVDPPAADRDQVADELRDGRGDRREDPARSRRPRERGEPAREQEQERATSVGPLVVEFLHGGLPCIDRVRSWTLQPGLAVATRARGRRQAARRPVGGPLPCGVVSSDPHNDWFESSSLTAEQLKAVTEALEAIVRDRGLLGLLTVEERTQLLRAAGDVYEPDLVQRRRWGKAVRRNEKAAKARRDEAVLADTGIRALREKPVFTTPNVFPPESFEQTEVTDDPLFREVVEPQHCYVCKQLYVGVHAFYDQLCPDLRRLQLRQALRDRRPVEPGGSPDRRAREDRLPGRDQAPAGRCRADRDDALPARRRGALRGGGGLRRLGRAGSRSTRSTCAIRRASRSSATTSPPPATASTSSSTTRARRCVGRPSSTAT